MYESEHLSRREDEKGVYYGGHAATNTRAFLAIAQTPFADYDAQPNFAIYACKKTFFVFTC